MDLLFVFGSGCMRGTFVEPLEPVTDEYPLCRTQQLLLCIALVLTRQVLYKFQVSKMPLEKMAMNVFEDHISELKDVPRIISETVQLENYIFRKPVVKKADHNSEKLIVEKEEINDLNLSMDATKEIADAVKQYRKTCYFQQYNAHSQSLVRTVKKVKEINLTLFYRKFATFHALAQLIELKDVRHLYFTETQLKIIMSDSECHKDDSYGLERALVKHYDCDLQRPLCLYDFTLKTIVLD